MRVDDYKYPKYLSITILNVSLINILDRVFLIIVSLEFEGYNHFVQNDCDITTRLVYPYLKDNRHTTYSVISTMRRQHLVDTL